MKTTESILKDLGSVIESRKGDQPDRSYIAHLFAKGGDTILKKIGEECVEVIIASKSGNNSHVIYESADLLFHLMVMLSSHNISLDAVVAELGRREGLSGLAEKAARTTGSSHGFESESSHG